MNYQDYNYAIDKTGQLVHIENAQHGSEYFCPYCNAPMITRQGKVNRWHFAHKNNIHNCSYESYLHKLAKIRIREHFYASECFRIAYHVNRTCKALCPLNRQPRCNWEDMTGANLRQYYNCCEEEKEYQGYRADLLLSHDQFQNRPPVLIEICVKHACTEEKRNSGLRIIEIKIQSEHDIDQLIEKSLLKETSDYIGNSVRLDDRIKFYNFKNEKEGNPPVNHQRPLHVYWIDTNLTFHERKAFNCQSPFPDHLSKVPFVMFAEESLDWAWCMQKAIKAGIQIKSCTLCKYRKKPFEGSAYCCLYKKFKTPKNPKIIEAKTCPYYNMSNDSMYEEFYNPHPVSYQIITNNTEKK